MSIQRDKLLHALVCALISLILIVVLGALRAPITACIVAGIYSAEAAGFAKEYADNLNPKNKWDWYDILADTIGAILGSAVGSAIVIFVG